MPTAPKRPCPEPGCRRLQPCEVHRRHLRAGQTYTDRKANEPWRAMYSTARWKRLRQSVLSREPLCRACAQESRWTLATVVDHIRPHRGDEALAYEPTNLQPLCAHHHSAKTAAEVWR